MKCISFCRFMLAMTAVALLAAPAFGQSPVQGSLVSVTEVGESCRASIAVSGEYGMERVSASLIAVNIPDRTIENAVQIPVSSRCFAAVTAKPLGEGNGVRVEMAVRPYSFRGLSRTPSGLQLEFDAAPMDGSRAGGDDIASDAYRIGVGDTLRVAVANHADLSVGKDAKVTRDGRITYDYVGSFEVAGQTATQIAANLQSMLDSQYLVDPRVSVSVKEYASQPVFVSGEVNEPGRQFLEGGTTLKDILAAARGFSKDAGDEVQVTRRKAGTEEQETFRFTRQEVEGDLVDLDLESGDVITVPKKKFYFIQGEVRLPSQYPYEPGRTLVQAISIAGGLKEWADRGGIVLLRTSGGKAISESYDLKKIYNLKTPDVPLEPNDIIIVRRRLL